MQLHKQIAVIVLAISIFSCRPGVKNNKAENKQEPELTESVRKERVEQMLDNIFPNKHYRIVLDKFSAKMAINDSTDEFIPNTVFSFQKLVNGQYIKLFTDSIACEKLFSEFKQFMGDSSPELLVNNNEDVRSNWSYYLYVVDTLKDQVRRIKNFETIKNPNYLPQYDLIDNSVLSGRSWTNFYRINTDSVIDLDLTFYGGGPVAEGEKDTYEEDYNKALQKALKKVKAINSNAKK